MTITGYNSETPENETVKTISGFEENLKKDSGKLIQNSILWTIRNHFRTIYPGSSNFSPDKVQPDSNNTSRNYGSVKIYTKGIGRAYHDVKILPVKAKALTIPLHQTAYGKKAGEFQDLFKITSKKGKQFLARENNGKLTYMYVLAKSAFQKQDDRLMPSPETMRDNISARIQAYIYNYALKNEK